MIPCSCAAILIAIAHFPGDLGIITLLFFTISVIVFIAYIVSIVKSLYSVIARCCKTRPRYLAINEQNDDIDENNDNNINIDEVSCHEC